MLMKISAAAFSAASPIPTTPLLMLGVLDILVILLAVILFPFLWKD
jgi:heme exporter protein B